MNERDLERRVRALEDHFGHLHNILLGLISVYFEDHGDEDLGDDDDGEPE